MYVTVCYVTGRQDPRVDWALDDLGKQSQSGDEIDFIVVDALGRDASRLGIAGSPSCVTSLTVTTPKPTAWQGLHRITSRDWWAMSSARNTGLVLARTDYVAFLDDRCHLGPRWLETVRNGHQSRASVICGAYEKHEDGKLTKDGRLQHAPDGAVNCGGRWLFGCTFALPLEWALRVNGFEEGMDGLSFEDVIFGLNLENAGYRIDYRPELFVSEERGKAQENAYKRSDKGTSPQDKSHASLERFGKNKRTTFTPDLRELRAKVAAGGAWPMPDPELRDWYDGQLVREMT